MAIVGVAVASAIGLLRKGRGQSLQYRLTSGGAWTDFAVEATLVPDAPAAEAHEAAGSGGLVMAATARLRVATGGPALRRGADGSQVRDQRGQVWAVTGDLTTEAQRVWLLKRISIRKAGADRGETA